MQRTSRMAQPACTAGCDMPVCSAYSWNSGSAPTSSVAAMRGAAAGGGAITSTSTPVRGDHQSAGGLADGAVHTSSQKLVGCRFNTC